MIKSNVSVFEQVTEATRGWLRFYTTNKHMFPDGDERLALYTARALCPHPEVKILKGELSCIACGATRT